MSRIFISYSRSDKTTVDEFIQQLVVAGHQVWVDRGGIRGGEQWRQEIVEAIEENDVFLLILSKNSAVSDHVRTETDLAKESRKRIIPIEIQPVVIPTTMKYQLAGLQRIKLYSDYEYGFQELLTALGGAPEIGTLERKLGGEGLRRGQKQIRNRTLLIAGFAALVLLFSFFGYQLFRKNTGSPEAAAAVNTPARTETQLAAATEVQDVNPVATPTEPQPLLPTDLPLAQAQQPEPTPTDTLTSLSAGSQVSLEELTKVEEIEPLLLQANIRLSEPEDLERTRSYFYGPESAYHMLAIACLNVVGERRFIDYINLDIVDKWYTDAVGSGYADRGALDMEIVVESLIKAHNDYWGDSATTLDDLLVPRG